jgi:hypothetical protein
VDDRAGGNRRGPVFMAKSSGKLTLDVSAYVKGDWILRVGLLAAADGTDGTVLIQVAAPVLL